MKNNSSFLKKSVALAFASASVLLASNVQAISLLKAYQEALKNDPMHRAAVADNRAGQEYQIMGRAAMLPSLQYSYSTNKNKGESFSPNQAGEKTGTDLDYRSTSKGFSARQTLFNVDAYTRYEQGVVQTKLSDAQFDSRSRDLMVRVLSAYSDAKYAEDQLNLYTAQRDAYTEQMLVNKRMFEKGEGTKTDMLETQAKLDVANAMVIEASDNALMTKHTLSSMIGVPVYSLDSLVSDFKPLPATDDVEYWKQIAFKENADIITAKLSLEAADLEIKKNLSGHFPRLDLNASYNSGISESITTRNQENNTRSIGIQLVIPIYSGGYVSASSRQAVANRDKARAELDATSSKLVLEIQKQFNAMKISSLKMEALQKSVESSTLLVEATKQSVKGGIRINLDLLNAQQQLVSVKRDLASSRYNYLISYLRLRVAAGSVTEDDLRTVAAYFVPQ